MSAEEPDAWIEVGPLEDLQEGGVAEHVVGGAIVALARVEGQVYAIDGICAHQGGPLGKGALDGCTLTCPWHGWQYDVRDGRQKLSEHIQQSRFRVRIEGDTIWVRPAEA